MSPRRSSIFARVRRHGRPPGASWLPGGRSLGIQTPSVFVAQSASRPAADAATIQPRGSVPSVAIASLPSAVHGQRLRLRSLPAPWPSVPPLRLPVPGPAARARVAAAPATSDACGADSTGPAAPAPLPTTPARDQATAARPRPCPPRPPRREAAPSRRSPAPPRSSTWTVRRLLTVLTVEWLLNCQPVAKRSVYPAGDDRAGH